MTEHLEILHKWHQSGLRIALARVVKTWGSSPRPMGSVMLINDKGEMSGSVSGGCVEAAVVKSAQQVFEDARSRVLSFGVSDEDAWSVGLSCGGQLEVFLQLINPSETPWQGLLTHLTSNESSVLVSRLEDGAKEDQWIDPANPGPTSLLSGEALSALRDRTHRRVQLEEQPYFVHVFPRKPQLLVIGASHITVDLVSLGNRFGFETIVIDPRGYFTEHIVFPEAPSRVISAYPSEALSQFTLDAYTFCAVLSHDPKIDDDALQVLLPSEVAYVGVLGSRKNQARRVTRLLDKGIAQELIDKLAAPIGLPINAQGAREIALSIMAQMIEVKNAKLER